jgi:Gram-negative bacterial TonB protein C-terminal
MDKATRLSVVLVLLSLTLFAEHGYGSELDDGGPNPISKALRRAIQRSDFTQPGAPPFHLRATSASAYSYGIDQSAEIEEYWVSPQKWKRTIRSKDFEQTVIVNGKLRFEQNSSDYYPKWLNDIVTALLEIVPAGAIRQVTALIPGSFSGGPVGGGTTYHPSSSDGTVTVSWGGRIEFDANGLLTWISSTEFSAAFKNYQAFHGKSVARFIETFPPVPRGDVNTQITELTDLKDPDESIFAVPSPTPLEQQIRTVQIPEVEYRKLAIDPPVMKLPPVKVQPTSGAFATYIVTDRNGKVRDCKFIISNNMSISDDATELVKQWHFKPFLVDGVPVQVGTTMTFAYDTEIVGEQAKFQAPHEYFDHGRDLTYPRTKGSPAFHMKGTFQGAGDFAPYQGNYEETWIAPDRWRRQITIGDKSVVETRIGEDRYSQTADPGIAEVVRKVLGFFCAEFPGYAYGTPDTDWSMSEVEFQGVLVTRVAMSHTDDDGNTNYPRAYYFDEKGLLRARSNVLSWPDSHPEIVTYDEFAGFAEKQVPRRIDSELDGVHTFTAHINLLEPTQPLPRSTFVLRGIKPNNWGGDIPW